MNSNIGNIEEVIDCESCNVSISEILEVELYLGFEFPESLKSIIKLCNGGKPIPNTVVYLKKERVFHINYFYTLLEIKNYKDIYSDDSFPEGYTQADLIPFAYDQGGGTFAISTKKNESGKIIFFYLEECATIYGEWKSFIDFLNSFKAIKE